MNDKKVTLWTVARFEFMRYFKWKHELINIGILVALMVISTGGGALMELAKSQEHYEVAVIGHAQLNLELGKQGRITLLRAGDNEREARQLDVDEQRLDGLLIIHDHNQAELVVNREPSWRKELETRLSAARLQSRLNEHGIDRARFDDWQKPVAITQQFTEHAKRPASERSRGIALALVIFTLIGVMTGFALFFVSITTEKQQRVSELVVSAISPAMWIDGKLLGISGHGLKSMLTMSLYATVGLFAIANIKGETSSVLASISPSLIVLSFLFALGGLLFWNTVMAAIAATIDDPNSSTRSSFMMLPMLFIMMIFSGIDSPENTMMQVLSWVPLTSLAAMPVRIANGVVTGWEIAGSFIVLVAATLYLRRLATRIFEAGMLYYGKDASWRQLWQWARYGGNI